MNVIQRLEDRLFKKKPMADTVTQAQPNQAAIPQQPAAPAPEVPNAPDTEPVVDENAQEEEAAPVEGREAFNCPDCQGEGLKDQYNQCDRCKGTGKI